jgi:tetratricopeptide (TPR) repeat protein
LHPLHVETVVWISDRKDLLCSFFWYLSIWAYVNYLEQPTAGKYALLLLAFICGLLSKPMIITLPCVLLLLDIWPLKRLSFKDISTPVLKDVLSLIKEKAPLFLLAIAGGLTAIYAQKVGGGLVSVADHPMTLRFSNALVAYKNYLLKTIWPLDLTVFYPYLLDHAFISILGALVLLAAVAAFAIFQIRTRPYWFVGWFWFLGTMVPAIGIFKIGDFAMADRYTYIPLTGLFLIIIWAGAELVGPRRYGRFTATGITLVFLVMLAVLTSRQITYWRTSETLYRHALEVTENNYMAHYGLGQVLASKGHFREAVLHFEKAAQLRPDKAPILINLGRALTVAGRITEAVTVLRTCVAKMPDNQLARFTLGLALVRDNQYESALNHFRDLARQIQAESISTVETISQAARVGYDQAVVMEQNGRIAEATALYQEVIDIQPDFLSARDRLSRIYIEKHDFQNALAIFHIKNNHNWVMRMMVSGFDRWEKNWRAY